MINRVAACGLLCLLTACSVPMNGDAPGSNSGADNRSVAIPQNYAPNALFMRQHGDFMLRREPWRAEAQISGLVMKSDEIKGEPGSFDILHAKADVERRIHLADPSTFVDVGVQYGHRHYSFSPRAQATPGGAPANVVLSRATATIQYGQFLDKDTLIEVDFVPGVWTDFGGTLHGDDWQFYGRGLLTWRYSNELFLLVGAEHSGLFRGLEIYPIAGVAWIPDEQWRVDVLLPRQVRLTHTPNDHNSVFLSVDLDGGNYQTRAPSPQKTPRRMSAQEFEVSLGGQHRFNANLSAFLRIGTTIGGHYEIQSNGPDSYDGTLEPQAFAEFGFGWTF